MWVDASIFDRGAGEERRGEKRAPVSHSYLEPRGEGILFSVVCVLASVIVYCGVLLVRFLG